MNTPSVSNGSPAFTSVSSKEEHRSAFQEVLAVMTAPYSDEEIEQLLHQEPINQSPMLPAEELSPDDNTTN